MTDTITTRFEALQEQKTQLEAEARARRSELLEELKVVCTLAGLIPRELLDGIVIVRKRGPKPGSRKKGQKKAAAKTTETTPEVTA